MNNQFFQTLLTKRGRFLNGENPSPAKLSAINAQIESAFAVIETFLGNGTDYLINTNTNRRVLPNISSALGTGEKIYKPVNFLHSLEQVARKYLSDATKYDIATKELTISANSQTFNIKVPSGSIIGLYYKTIAGNQVTITVNGVAANFPANTTSYSWAYTAPSAATVELFTVTCSGGVKLKSFVISNVTDGMTPIQSNNITTLIQSAQHVANIGYSIPINNDSYFTVKTPCHWASSERQGTSQDPVCNSKTCNYCIGNTYDMVGNVSTLGAPICSGALFSNGASGTYTPDSTVNKTIQSPLLTIDNPYTAKYMPYRMYDGVTSGVMLPSNLFTLYDINQTIPVIQNLNFYSASSTRGDIVFTKDQIDTSNNTKQYLLIGGKYGMSNMIWDILGVVKGY